MIETSRGTTARRRLPMWHRGRGPGLAESSSDAGPKGPGVWATAAWVVVIALACLTTLAAAEVSVTLALVYWFTLVMIFVTPRGGGAKAAGRGSVAGEESASLGQERSDDVNELHGVAAFHSSGAVLQAPAEEVDSREQPAWEAGTARPRRSRVRVRKPAKPAGEPITPPVTWVRVGPGRFVRADVAGASGEAHVASPDPLESPSLETGADYPVEAVDPIEPAVGELEPTGTTSAADERLEVEEYGNAPSALESSFSEALDEIDPVEAAELINEAIEDGEEPAEILFETQLRPRVDWRQTALSGSWRREVVRTTLSASRGLWRRGFASTRNRRTGSVLLDASQRRIRRYTDRAAGRIAHVERGFRPRSPPARGTRRAHRASIESAPRARRSWTAGGNAPAVCGQPGSWRFPATRAWTKPAFKESTSRRHN